MMFTNKIGSPCYSLTFDHVGSVIKIMERAQLILDHDIFTFWLEKQSQSEKINKSK